MKRRISFQFVAVTILILVIFIVGATLIARRSLNDSTELNLRHYVDIVETDVEESRSYDDIIDKYKDLSSDIRITFIDEDGIVLADSSADDLDNHLDRPEIKNPGAVYIRESDTLNMQMMYLSKTLNNGDYLRVSIPTESTLQFLNDFIGFSIVLGLIIMIVTIFISVFLINQSLKPLEDVKNNLISVNEGHYQDIMPVKKYDEVNAFIREINAINKTISSNISSLKTEKSKTDFLINQMKQGICVLDQNKHIIFINNYLKDIYRFNIDININKDYRFLFREDNLQNTIEELFQTEQNKSIIVEKNQRYYNVSLNYSKDNWRHLPSAIIIYTDITAIRQLEILKKDFFVNASHELKTPLTSIMGSADIIKEDMAKDKEMVIDLARRIHQEATRMNDLVMDMLKLTEIESQDQIKNHTVFIVDHLVDDVINNLSVLIKEKNIQVEKTINVHTFEFNPEDFYQLLKNIIENAIKYNRENGHVWVDISSKNKKLYIKIKDDGIGIPQDDQTRVFERFYRVDKARSRASSGTGLGLSIVKHILINAGGEIELESSENQGTLFTITLPIND
jgi:two-component system phosphate regulon sensor histidine kinase PhoR